MVLVYISLLVIRQNRPGLLNKSPEPCSCAPEHDLLRYRFKRALSQESPTLNHSHNQNTKESGCNAEKGQKKSTYLYVFIK